MKVPWAAGSQPHWTQRHRALQHLLRRRCPHRRLRLGPLRTDHFLARLGFIAWNCVPLYRRPDVMIPTPSLPLVFNYWRAHTAVSMRPRCSPRRCREPSTRSVPCRWLPRRVTSGCNGSWRQRGNPDQPAVPWISCVAGWWTSRTGSDAQQGMVTRSVPVRDRRAGLQGAALELEGIAPAVISADQVSNAPDRCFRHRQSVSAAHRHRRPVVGERDHGDEQRPTS